MHTGEVILEHWSAQQLTTWIELTWIELRANGKWLSRQRCIYVLIAIVWRLSLSCEAQGTLFRGMESPIHPVQACEGMHTCGELAVAGFQGRTCVVSSDAPCTEESLTPPRQQRCVYMISVSQASFGRISPRGH